MAESAASETNSAEVPATNPPAPEGDLGIRSGASMAEASNALAQRRKQKAKAAVQPAEPSGQPDENNRSSADSQGGQEAQEAPSGADDVSEPDGSGEQPATEAGDFPTTFSGLAEALGADSNDLAYGLTAPVKINGQELEISIGEALEGYQRQQDYTRRTQELSEAQRSFEAERDQILERAKQQINTAENWLGVVAGAIQAGPTDAELAAMATTDPDRYIAEKARRDNLTAAYQHVALQRQAMAEKAGKEVEASKAKVFEEQRQALVRMSRDRSSGVADPTDPEKWPAFEGKVRAYLGKKGFSEKDVGDFLSPGAWTAPQMAVIADAIYGQTVRQKGAGAGEKVRQLPKVMMPGAPKDRTESNKEKVAAARKRLQTQNTGRRGDQNAIALLRAQRQARKGR